MDGTIIGLVAVIMSLGIPLGAMYTYYRVRKLRTEERLAPLRAESASDGAGVDPRGAVAALGHPVCVRRDRVPGGAGLIAQIEHEPETWSARFWALFPSRSGLAISWISR